MKILKNKKGNLLDIIFAGGVILAFAMVILFGFKFMTEFNDEIQSISGMDQDAKESTARLTGFYPGVVDNSFLFFTVALAIGAFILAALIRVSPIFIPLYLLALTFVIFLSGVFSNIYQEAAANPLMASSAAQLTFTTNILTYLPMITGVFGSILALVMYKSWRDSQGV